MIHSEKSFESGEGEYSSNFQPILQSSKEKQSDLKEQKKYAIIDHTIRVQLLRKILSKQSTIKEAAKQFGVNFSTAKAILQTYRKEGRIGKKKTRDRNKKEKLQQETPSANTRKVQSMYDLEREVPQKMTSSTDFKPAEPKIQSDAVLQQQIFQFNQQRNIMSSPNLDETGTQIALVLCQRELARQKMLNMQLVMMIQNMQGVNQQQQQQTIVKEESENLN